MPFFSKSASEDADFENKFKILCQWLRAIDQQNKEILYQLKILRNDKSSSVTQRYYETPERVPMIEPGEGE